MKKNSIFATAFLLFAFFISSVGNARDKAIVYLHPLEGSRLISAETNIILRFKETVNAKEMDRSGLIKVSGDIHGPYSGKVILADDDRTLLFLPDIPFKAGEKVSVSISSRHLVDGNYDYHFWVSGSKSQPERIKVLEESHYESSAGENKLATYGKVTNLNGVHVPSSFPIIDVPVNTGNTASGKLFFGVRNKYYIIMENDGTPYYFMKISDFIVDFNVQQDTLLSRGVDRGGFDATGKHYFILMDNKYNEIDTFTVGNGYYTDHHDFRLLDNGHALMICRDYQQLDLTDSIPDGGSNVTVIGNHIQELDAEKNVVFEWRSWDHLTIADAVHENLYTGVIDYAHINSVSLDFDGNILISCRNLSQCIKIDRETGEIIWRLGGVKNDFDFINDPDQNSYQHMFRAVPGIPNNYTLFDNGNYHEPRYSRGVEYSLDTVSMTAEMVWQYRGTPDFAADWLGGTMRLPNGNTIINWGNTPNPLASEVTPDGTLVYEAYMPEINHSYRTYRHEWTGVSDEPFLYCEVENNTVIMVFNKFGDTHVDYYKIYGGESPDEMELMGTTPETRYDIPGLTDNTTYYFRVTAVNKDGIESPPSEIFEVLVQYIYPGRNIIRYGNFTLDTLHGWNFSVSDGASANQTVTEDHRLQVNITDGGPEVSSVRLSQQNIALYNGQKYIFEFDAQGDAPRTIEAKILDTQEPHTNYGEIGASYINARNEHFTYEFEMTAETDLDAMAVFDLGADNGDVWLDNISLIIEGEPVMLDEGKNREKFVSSLKIYPDPFSSEATLSFMLEAEASVKLDIFTLSGQLAQNFNMEFYDRGYHEKKLRRNALPEGMYFCRIQVNPLNTANNELLFIQKITVINEH